MGVGGKGVRWDWRLQEEEEARRNSLKTGCLFYDFYD